MDNLAEATLRFDTLRSRTSPDVSLHGRWRVVTWITWVCIASFAVVLYIVAMFLEFHQLRTPCAGVGFICESGQVTPRGVQRLHEVGLTVTAFAALSVGMNLVFGAVWCGTGMLIVWRKPHHLVALIVALWLVLFGTTFFAAPTTRLTTTYPMLLVPTQLLRYVGADVCLALFFFVFPDGRFVPRWTRWLVVIYAASRVPYYFFPSRGQWLESMGIALWFGVTVLVCQLASQIYRYGWVSTPEQRQQTKWVVAGVVAATLGAVLVGVATELLVSVEQVEPIPALLMQSLLASCLLLIPLTIGIAVLRYRLWDIDPIINRTLVYGVLTASIIGLYVLMVGALGVLFQTSGNLFTSLVATGVVAVLFQPLRERLQRGVNRLMYGQRDEPYAVLSRLGQRLEATLAPDAMLPTIVETIKEALKLPYVALAVP